MEYSEALAETICEHVAAGKTMRALDAMPDMPCSTTVLKWQQKIPGFKQAMDLARELSADQLADDAVHIADTEKDAQRARIMADVRKWIAGCRAPRKYGQRMDLNVTNTVDFRAAHLAGMQRVLTGRDQVTDLVAERAGETVTYVPRPTDSQSVAGADEQVDPFS